MRVCVLVDDHCLGQADTDLFRESHTDQIGDPQRDRSAIPGAGRSELCDEHVADTRWEERARRQM